MNVHGCDCSIVIKTSHFEMDIPYSDETLRVPDNSTASSSVDEKGGTARAQIIAAVCRKCGLALARPAGDRE